MTPSLDLEANFLDLEAKSIAELKQIAFDESGITDTDINIGFNPEDLEKHDSDKRQAWIAAIAFGRMGVKPLQHWKN